MGVIGRLPKTWAVMVNAKPVPGSLSPELSIVLTSTTPCMLSLITSHGPGEPVCGMPLIQMLVNDGLVIRDPRATVRGIRYVVLTDTKMM